MTGAVREGEREARHARRSRPPTTARFGTKRRRRARPGCLRRARRRRTRRRGARTGLREVELGGVVGTSGVNAVKRSASTKMIALTRRRRRRSASIGSAAKRKCTEPVTPSSDFPTDHRRSDNHSESHQPQTLRSRCIAELWTDGNRSSTPGHEIGAICDIASGGLASPVANCADLVRSSRPGLARTTLRPVARRGGDLRRRRKDLSRTAPLVDAIGPPRNAPSRLRLRPASRLTPAEAAADRRAINLGRSVLGASRDSRGRGEPVKAPHPNSPQFAFFSFHTGSNCALSACSGSRERKRAGQRRPGRKNSPSRERFRPPSRRTFRFRVVLLGGLRPTGAPCSAQPEIYDKGQGPIKGVA